MRAMLGMQNKTFALTLELMKKQSFKLCYLKHVHLMSWKLHFDDEDDEHYEQVQYYPSNT